MTAEKKQVPIVINEAINLGVEGSRPWLRVVRTEVKAQLLTS